MTQSPTITPTTQPPTDSPTTQPPTESPTIQSLGGLSLALAERQTDTIRQRSRTSHSMRMKIVLPTRVFSGPVAAFIGVCGTFWSSDETSLVNWLAKGQLMREAFCLGSRFVEHASLQTTGLARAGGAPVNAQWWMESWALLYVPLNVSLS